LYDEVCSNASAVEGGTFPFYRSEDAEEERLVVFTLPNRNIDGIADDSSMLHALERNVYYICLTPREEESLARRKIGPCPLFSYQSDK